MPITKGLSMQTYLATDALSSGVAFRAISQSPLHARFYQTAPEDNCKVADIGTVAHQILLEGHEENIVLVDAEDWRTKDAKEQRDAAYAERKVPLLAKQIQPVRQMVAAARVFVEQSEIRGAFGKGDAEVTVQWTDVNGVKCKARPDYLTERFHISLKTTAGSAERVGWCRRQLGPLGYDFGLEFYKRGLLANDIKVYHRILVIEQQPPHGCSLIELDALRAEVNKAKVKKAIQLWGQCLHAGEFPGYSQFTYAAELAPWEISAAEDENLISLYA